MEPARSAFVPLLLCSVVSAVSGVRSALVSIPSVVHGTCGERLLLPVEYHFDVWPKDLQGTWYFQGDSSDMVMLVTFSSHTLIMNMVYNGSVSIHPPNASLLINRLDETAEGWYRLDLNFRFPGVDSPVLEKKVVHVFAHVPVSVPVIEMSPGSEVVEDKDNVTLRCSVKTGSRAQYLWLKDGVVVGAGERRTLSRDNGTLAISPATKEDIGEYVCVARNFIGRERSRPLPLRVFYGPYNLEVSSQQGLKTGEVFMVDPGEPVLFECWADSDPPNSCVWISKSSNSSRVITGSRFEVMSNRLAHKEDFVCRAFNNVTQKQDETQFTLVVASLGTGKKQEFLQAGSSVSHLAAITVSSLVIIGCMLLVIFRKRSCCPHRVMMNIYNRPLTEPKRTHLSGHEDATEDFGIYEFVTIPGKSDSTQASSRSLAGLNSVQDLHTTIYDVIRHIPETPTQGLLK
ncbi:HEPACAM family member 2 isoform X2 [Scleropages formosus]|uniref:HEPACAM family member 2 isoform X2 n=1 Tax=Scleropages formosus TaxID=113540 RepID=UPI0008784BE2|nr:HEPACAM family member 2 isoform X2 [Scleropages formosus]